ncbi:hypothetical protein K5V21_17230 [Clostridium sardiniense]|uniref:Uncharacterized protein n=1 Tax=Clostridium sardiniense TaxID=29369 RepID=A0ABS7L274_CLOSR|nr:hypothetical protein [Clostridium sardiniense]MBY0757176.1 hypothetical protein [Clostridium sardiniense]MDQ0461650.1 hypothetical protein [Clostridium sardiniense]
MIYFGTMDWSIFNYKSIVISFFMIFMVVEIFLFSTKLFWNNHKKIEINIFTAINVLISMVSSSLLVPFLLVGMIEISNNTGVNVEKIIWIILGLCLIKKFHIKIYLLIKRLIPKKRLE